MKHRGLCHAHLLVRDLERSVRFYTEAFGLQVLHRRTGQVFLRTPGMQDCLTLRELDGAVDPAAAGASGGIDHLGFPLADPAQLDAAIGEVLRAGGRLLERTSLVEGGIPTAFVADPDGYRIQL